MSQQLEITLVRSMIGRPPKHRKILKALGLTRVGKTVWQKDSPAIRGMIAKISHMVCVKGENNETP